MTRARVAQSIVWSVLCLAGLGVGCSAFDASLLEGLPDGGVGCVPRRPPEAPAVAPPGDVGDIYFALRDVSLEQSEAWRDLAYDLDGLCTAAPDLDHECIPPSLDEGIALDGPGGVDNVIGREVIPSIVVLGGSFEGDFRAHEELGLGTVLLRVRGWNGGDDDDQVDVTIAGGAFGTPPLSDGTAPPLPMDGTLPPPPLWNGEDFFWADSGAFVGGDEESPRNRDDRAYVARRTLVVHPPDRTPFLLTTETTSIEILLSDVTLAGTLSADHSRLSNVILAGRWVGTDLLAEVPMLGFCSGSTVFNRVLLLLSLHADLLSTPGSAPPTSQCNTLSAGIGLTGYQVQWAGTTTPPPRPVPCP